MVCLKLYYTMVKKHDIVYFPSPRILVDRLVWLVHKKHLQYVIIWLFYLYHLLQ